MRALCVAIFAFSAGVTAQESFLPQAIGQWNNTNDAYQKIQDCKLTVDFIEAKMSVQVLDECDLDLLSAYVLQNECRLERLDHVEINSEWSSKRFKVNANSCALLGEGNGSEQAVQPAVPPEPKPEKPENQHADSVDETYRDALNGDSYVLQYYGSAKAPDLTDLTCLNNDFTVVKEQGMYFVWSASISDYDQAVALSKAKKVQCPEIPNWVKRISDQRQQPLVDNQYKQALEDPNVDGFVLQFYNGRKLPVLDEFSCLGDDLAVVKYRGQHYVWSPMFDTYNQAKALGDRKKAQCPDIPFWVKRL